MRIYRGMLIVCGFFAWAAVMLQLVAGAAEQPEDGAQTSSQLQQDNICFPVSLARCALTVEEQACYEGPFPEDGTDRYVVDTAALVISNHSGTTVERGAVILRQQDRVYIFEVYALPPGEKALVMEKYGRPYTGARVTACFGWSETEGRETDRCVDIREEGIERLSVTNVSAGRLDGIRIRFKTYDPDSGMYIGGIAYEVTVRSLAPGETTTLTPYRYLKDHSRIVSVTAGNALG